MKTVYALLDPITLEVRYIGSTKNSLKTRLSAHLSPETCNNKEKTKWIKELKSKRKKPFILPLDIDYDSTLEKYYINYFIEKGHNLFNIMSAIKN